MINGPVSETILHIYNLPCENKQLKSLMFKKKVFEYLLAVQNNKNE